MTSCPGDQHRHKPCDLPVRVGGEYTRATSTSDTDLSSGDRGALKIYQAQDWEEAVGVALEGFVEAPAVPASMALFLRYEAASDHLRGVALRSLADPGARPAPRYRGKPAGPGAAARTSRAAAANLEMALQGLVLSLREHPRPWAQVCRERAGTIVAAVAEAELCELLPVLREEESDLALLPVHAGDCLAGVVVLQLPHAAARPGCPDLTAAETLAAHLARALQRLDTGDEQAARIRSYQAVEEAGHALVKVSNLPDLFSILARAATQALEAQRAVLWSYDQSSQRLDLAAQHVAVSSEAMDALLPRLKEVADRCAASGASFLYRDLRSEEAMDLGAWPQALPLSVVPLSAFGEVVGVAAAVGRRAPQEDRPFRDTEERLLQLLADQGAVAVKVARQAEQLRHAGQRLKEMQKMLIAAEKLASIGELSARLAEDLRGPISAVAGFARQLEKTLPAQETVRDDARILAQEAARIEEILVEQIQLVKESTPRMRPQQINRIVHDCVALLREEMTGHGIFLEETYADRLPELLLDEARIKHMLINILRNALERTRDGDTIRIETVREGDRLLLEIAHTGDSLPGDILESLFVPFATDRPAGAGLGLAVANQAVKEHGGEISVRAEGEWGSVYTISLPIQANRERRGLTPRRSGRERRGGRAA